VPPSPDGVKDSFACVIGEPLWEDYSAVDLKGTHQVV